MYDEKIENLINFALADGELTEKEKQILFKKAEEAGIDLDEFEMVLDAKLHEKLETTKQVVEQTSAAPKSNKLGDVKKCPECGAIAEAFTSKCSDCSFEFRNIGANKSVEQLSKQLQAVIDRCDSKSYDKEDDEEAERRIDITAKQKEVISNFPIPQTREDLLELLYFIHPKIKADFSSDESGSAWKSKFIEVINRARVAFASDEKVIKELDKYENDLKDSIQKNKKHNFLKNVLGIASFLAVGGSLLFLSGIIDLESNKEQKRLKAIEEVITNDIRTKRFEDASLLLIELDWSLTEDKEKNFIDDLIKHKDKYEDKRKYWKHKKSQLEALINNNK